MGSNLGARLAGGTRFSKFWRVPKNKALLAAIRRKMLKVPQGVAALYPLMPPNRPTPVFKGQLVAKGRLFAKAEPVAKPGQVRLAPARLDYHWLPSPRLRFSASVRGELDFESEAVHIRAPRNGAWVEAMVTQSTIGTRRPHAEGFVQDCLRIGPDRPVQSVLFHVPNFHSYVGESVRFDRTLHKGRLVLTAGAWIATIDESPRHRDILQALRVHGGYGITHAGLITRVDGARFRVAAMSDFWSMLMFFLTFARGNWCSPIIPVGMGSRGPVWTEWCSWRIKPWREVKSWFPTLSTQTQQAFAGFHALWSNPSWNEPLRDLVNWYVEANLNAGAVEGSLVLAHTGLELLSWMYLVEERQLYSPKVFKEDHPSDDRIRLALAALRIPSDVPRSFPDAHALAATVGLKDGPELINRLRNSVVHPTPTKRAFLAQVSISCRVQVTQLALHFIELGILAVCGYKGDYITRLMPGAWVSEATAKVPWG